MLASELATRLLQQILTDGDGEVVFSITGFGRSEEISTVVKYEDEDASGVVTKRMYVLT